MSARRVEQFSDGVIAILITVMVLELRIPHGKTWSALRDSVPVLLTYLLSFVYLAIYWNNHHHLLMATERVSALVLWANLHLLFWLSLIPFTTGWLDESDFAATPAAAYGIVLLAAGLAYLALQAAIIHLQGEGSTLALAIGRDLKGKLSTLLYALGIGLTFVNRWFDLYARSLMRTSTLGEHPGALCGARRAKLVANSGPNCLQRGQLTCKVTRARRSRWCSAT